MNNTAWYLLLITRNHLVIRSIAAAYFDHQVLHFDFRPNEPCGKERFTHNENYYIDNVLNIISSIELLIEISSHFYLIKNQMHEILDKHHISFTRDLH